MQRKFETEGHDINKFEVYYTQEDGKGFSLEDPPKHIYYFNKYGGWKDEVDGKIYYYDADCNPMIDDIPSDIDDLQEDEDERQRGTSHESQPDKYVQELQQDLKEYSASSDEEDIQRGEVDDDGKALDEMTSSSEDEENKSNQNDQSGKKFEEQSSREQQSVEQNVFVEKDQGNYSDEETKQGQDNNSQDDDQKSDSNHQTDESGDSERFRLEYINELEDVINANEIETTCIHVEKIPADMNQNQFLKSFSIKEEQEKQIIHIFYGPIEKELDDNLDEEASNNEIIDVKNAAIIVTNKDFAKILIQNEGKPLYQNEERSLYLDVLTEPKEYFPLPYFNDQIYTNLIDILKQIPVSAQKGVQLKLQKPQTKEESIDFLFDKYPSISKNDLDNQNKESSGMQLISIWNDLINNKNIHLIQQISLL